MAGSSESAIHLSTKVEADTEVAEAWEDHFEGYETKSEALRAALRTALVEEGGAVEDADGGVTFARLVAIALLAGALGSLIAQAALVYDVVVATGLYALTGLVVVGIARYWGGE